MIGRRWPARAGVLVALALVALTLLAVACGRLDNDTTSTTLAPSVEPVPVDYSGPGPYPIGLTMITTADAPAMVWYPAASADDEAPAASVDGYDLADVLPAEVAAAVPAGLVPPVETSGLLDAPLSADGPFPVVLYSHDVAGFSRNASHQAEHLASWGFVVAAPQHADRDLLAALFGTVGEMEPAADVRELRATLGRLAQENARSDGVLRNGLDLDRVGAIGHGAGGRAVALLANDPDVDVWIGQATTAPLDPLAPLEQLVAPPLGERLAGATPPNKPSMLLAAADDRVVTLDDVQVLFEWLPSPKRLAVLAGTGHQVFTDLCEPLSGRAGLAAVVEAAPELSDLATRLDDGCLVPSPAIGTAAEVIDHLDTAMLRWALGLDATEVSLDPAYVEGLFPGALGSYVVE